MTAGSECSFQNLNNNLRLLITVRDRMTVSINHNSESHTGFLLVPTSVTLNDLEWRNSLILRYFTEFDSFAGQLRHSG